MKEMVWFLIELALLFCIILLVNSKADGRILMEACTFYLAAVIRHNQRRE